MATPTPITQVRRIADDRYHLHWRAIWATTDNFTDSIIIGRSALAAPLVKDIEILKVIVQTTPGIDVLLEYEHSGGDEPIVKTPLGQLVPLVWEPPGPSDGFFASPGLTVNATVAAAGDGDVLLTTLSAASGDEVVIDIWARLRLS